MIVILWFYFSSVEQNEKELDYRELDYTIPANARIILHFSTLTDTTVNLSPNPTSQIYYYDANGNIIGKVEKNEEIMRDFIVEDNETVAFLFKNNTVLSDLNGYKSLEPNSEIHINTDRFGPSQTGYIGDKEIFYSLLNVGQKPGEKYINVVRFVSLTKNYDVVIPYYIENIAYDKITHKVICAVSDLNDSMKTDIFKYIALTFDGSLNQFVMEENLYEIPYDENSYYSSNDIMFKTTMANDNFLYSVFVADTEEFLEYNNEKMRTHGNLILTTINLKNGTSTDQILKENYKLDSLGYGVLTGSDHLPMKVIDGILYVFTSDLEVFIIKSQSEVKKLKIPYEFQGSLSLKHPFKNDFKDKENFFGSEIKIHNGQIYILNLFPNKTLKIHKLLDNATYELIWEGRLPTIKRHDLFINTFEILD